MASSNALSLGEFADIEIGDVQACIDAGGWKSIFPPKIEKTYHYYRKSLREAGVKRSLWPILIIYNLLLITDIYMLPDTARISAALHFGFVTPVIVAVYFIYFRLDNLIYRQFSEAAVPIAIAIQIMTVFVMSQNPLRAHYQYFMFLVVFWPGGIQRFTPKIAHGVTAVLLAIYLAAVLTSDLQLAVKIFGLSQMLAVAFLGYRINLRSYKESRFGFLKRLEDEIRYREAALEAELDPLTGLKNRRYLEAFQKEKLPSFYRQGLPLAALMIDIDEFKSFNDYYGHLHGDMCIKNVASAIVSSIRSQMDVAVRYGGEEFLVLIPGLTEERALAKAEIIRGKVKELAIRHAKSKVGDHVTISIGIASGLASDALLKGLIASADAALYSAKAAGRDRVCVNGDETDTIFKPLAG